MKEDQGKVIFSLLAGATAGIVAGLLLAPETGGDARNNLRQSAAKWKDDVSKRVKSLLGQAPGHTNPDAAVSEDKQAADRLLQGLAGAPAPTVPAQADGNEYGGLDEEIRRTGTL